MRRDEDSAATDPGTRPYTVQRAPTASAPGPTPAPDASTPDLPGCRPVPLPRCDLDDWEGRRLEYWDGDTETAWVVCEPVGVAHEHPLGRLATLCTLIAEARGAAIEFLGSTDLELHDEHGERQKILQADQCVYLYPGRARLPEDGGMVVGKHDYPDVVLEVDHTTDVRRWKLGMYESWGFPEVWVEVPERRSRSRPRGLRPGLTIHLLEDGRYRESDESRAFPGWEASAIHEALTEAEPTDRTHARLERVGRTLGKRDGTGPDDYPLIRSLRAESRAEGEAKGRAQGRAEGWAMAVREMLLSRGIAVSEEFPANAPGFAESREDVVIAAAFACGSEEDFRVRIRGG